MRVVILAGGFGTRLVEETEIRPKPMVEIGGKPIIWHILKHYDNFGFNEFFIALGYKGEMIKRFFLDYRNLDGSMKIDLASGDIKRFGIESEAWKISLIDTGFSTNTGGRLKRMHRWLDNSKFMVTYGDGVCNLDFNDLLKFHNSHGRIGTITAVRPPSRFGGIIFQDDLVSEFTEKPQIGEGWINGGYMVFEPEIFNYLEDDTTSLEADALEKLASDSQLMAYRHDDFWQCMDTLRDVRLLESLWKTGNPPWRVWE